MPGGEKKRKKGKKFNSTTDRINLKVKVHKPAAPSSRNANGSVSVQARHHKNGEAARQKLSHAYPSRLDKKGKAPGAHYTKADGSKAEKKTKQENIVKEIIETAEEIEERNWRLAVKVEQQKKIIMWSGVTFFMLLIVFLWIFNAKQILKPIEDSSKNEIPDFDLWQIGGELSTKIQELKENLAEVRNFTDNASSTIATSTVNTTAASTITEKFTGKLPDEKPGETATATPIISDDTKEIMELRKKLDELEKKLEKK